MAPKVDARRRAREAKAVLDAERMERDKKIEETAIAFYVADDKIQDLRDQLTQAETERNAHVLALLDLGETADRVAVLTGLTTKDIRQIKRTATTTEPENR